MNKNNTIKSKVSVFLAVVFTLLLLTPFFITLRSTNQKYLEYQQNYENKHFSDVAVMGKQHIHDYLGKMTEKVYDAGLTLSLIGTYAQDEERYFPELYDSTKADEILVFASDGSLTYGKMIYGELFLQTAQEALSSGNNAVSELKQCSDGVKRMGIVSPFTAPDGGSAAIMLLFSQSSLEPMLEIPNLSNDGRLFVVDSEGSLVLSQKLEEQWINDGQFAVGTNGDSKEQLQVLTALKDGKEYLAYKGSVGINDWFVVYAAPKEQIDVKSYVDLARTRAIGLIVLFLIISLIGFSWYRGNLSSQWMDLFKEKFRIATRQSARAAFEYNRQMDRLTFISESEHVMLPKPYLSLSELGNLVHPADRAAYMQSVADLRGKGTTSTTVRMFNFCGKEVYRWYHVTATLITNFRGREVTTIGTVEDIDERENERLVLYEKATTDSLTGLWNRAEIERLVNERLSRLEANEHSVFTILDLDDFKDINDDFGHDCGDKALCFFAEKLRYTFRFGDVLGRLGGDEFVVYMTFTAEKEIVERRLKELMENMLSRCDDDCNMPPITCSIGCCVVNKGDTFESIYKRADEALYKSKTLGKQHFTIVD